MWTGGLCGAAAVAGMVVGVPRVGAAAYFAAFLCAQLSTALLFDSVGAFGFPTIAPSARRAAGVSLAVAAAAAYQLPAPCCAAPGRDAGAARRSAARRASFVAGGAAGREVWLAALLGWRRRRSRRACRRREEEGRVEEAWRERGGESR